MTDNLTPLDCFWPVVILVLLVVAAVFWSGPEGNLPESAEELARRKRK